jgi:hypothetical protein
MTVSVYKSFKGCLPYPTSRRSEVSQLRAFGVVAGKLAIASVERTTAKMFRRPPPRGGGAERREERNNLGQQQQQQQQQQHRRTYRRTLFGPIASARVNILHRSGRLLGVLEVYLY